MDDQNLPIELLRILVVGLLAAGCAVPLFVRVLSGISAASPPRGDHSGAIPLLGGSAIFLAIPLALSQSSAWTWTSRWPSIAVCAALAFSLGFLDDHRPLDAGLKLLGQVVIVGVLVLGGTMVRLPFPDVVNLILTTAWVIGITNAINLLDNMDGVAGGIGAIGALAFAVLAALEGTVAVAALGFAVGGAVLGFLLHNAPPARVFLGDSGSLLLGFCLAVLGIEIEFSANRVEATWLVPIVVLGLPIFDTVLVTWSRLRRGLNPLTTPGHDHVSHRLRRLGFSRWGVLGASWGGAVGLGVLGFAVSRGSVAFSWSVASLLTVLCFLSVAWLEAKVEAGAPRSGMGSDASGLS